MREDDRAWVKDHKNIHGIVEKTNSNKRRKVERQMASQTQIQVAEEDEQDIKWGKSVRHSKSSALAKQLKSLLTDVKNIRTITLQYAYVTAALQSTDGTIAVVSETAYSRWINEKTSKPKFLSTANIRNGLLKLVDDLEAEKEHAIVSRSSTVYGEEAGFMKYDKVVKKSRKVRLRWKLLPNPSQMKAPA
jgi:hypothetical protein